MKVAAALVITTPSRVAVTVDEDEDAKVGLSLTSRGYTLEDLDPTPVPTGCPRCWEAPGSIRRKPTSGRCGNCPERAR